MRLITRIVIILLIIQSLSTPKSITAQIPLTPDYEQVTYMGKEYGAAGIILTLIETAKTEVLSPIQQQRLDQLISSAMYELWQNRIFYEGQFHPSWSKSLETRGQNTIYPGDKYGTTGIIEVLLSMYDYSNDALWLERAENAFWLLIDQASNSSTHPHWSYVYQLPRDEGGIAITDSKYGSAAVLNKSMHLYQQTGNNSYLDVGQLIVDYLYQISTEKELGGQWYRVIPWWESGDVGEYFTGYQTGIAGLSPLLYQFGIFTNDTVIKNWAIEMTQFLLNIQQSNGSWEVEEDRGNFYVSYDQGIAGVLKGLNEMKQLEPSLEVSISIQKGIDYVFSHLLKNETHLGFYLDHLSSVIYNSYYRGTLGVMKVLYDLRNYLTSNQLSLLTELYNWYFKQEVLHFRDSNIEYLVNFYKPYEYDWVDLSLGEGLAGVMMELIRMSDTSFALSLDGFDVSRLINASVNSLLRFHELDNLWPRQIEFEFDWLNNSIVPIIIRTDNNELPEPFFNTSMRLLIGILVVLVSYKIYNRNE